MPKPITPIEPTHLFDSKGGAYPGSSGYGIDIPKEALGEKTKITLGPIKREKDIVAGVQLVPDGLKFKKPILLAFPVEPKVPLYEGTPVKLSYKSEGDKEWKRAELSNGSEVFAMVVKNGSLIVFLTDHFSNYSVSVNEVNALIKKNKEVFGHSGTTTGLGKTGAEKTMEEAIGLSNPGKDAAYLMDYTTTLMKIQRTSETGTGNILDKTKEAIEGNKKKFGSSGTATQESTQEIMVSRPVDYDEGMYADWKYEQGTGTSLRKSYYTYVFKHLLLQPELMLPEKEYKEFIETLEKATEIVQLPEDSKEVGTVLKVKQLQEIAQKVKSLTTKTGNFTKRVLGPIGDKVNSVIGNLPIAVELSAPVFKTILHFIIITSLHEAVVEYRIELLESLLKKTASNSDPALHSAFNDAKVEARKIASDFTSNAVDSIIEGFKGTPLKTYYDGAVLLAKIAKKQKLKLPLSLGNVSKVVFSMETAGLITLVDLAKEITLDRQYAAYTTAAMATIDRSVLSLAESSYDKKMDALQSKPRENRDDIEYSLMRTYNAYRFMETLYNNLEESWAVNVVDTTKRGLNDAIHNTDLQSAHESRMRYLRKWGPNLKNKYLELGTVAVLPDELDSPKKETKETMFSTTWEREWHLTPDRGFISTIETYDGNFISLADDSPLRKLFKFDRYGKQLWDENHGMQSPSDMQQTKDGGFIICGGYSNAEIIKTDKNGKQVWSKDRIAENGYTEYHNFKSVRQTDDGGYIATGGGCHMYRDVELWLYKTDSNGKKLWGRTFGKELARFSGSNFAQGFSVQQTSDGGFIVAGAMFPFASLTSSNALLVRTDSNGNKTWAKTFGIPKKPTGLDKHDVALSVQQSNDGGFVFAGYSASDKTSKAYIVKTDAGGNAIKEHRFSLDNTATTANSIQRTKDGGFIIGGGYNTSKGWICKLNPEGEILWTKPIPSKQSTSIILSVSETKDSDYILTTREKITKIRIDENNRK